jgi:hypothetical protein
MIFIGTVKERNMMTFYEEQLGIIMRDKKEELGITHLVR